MKNKTMFEKLQIKCQKAMDFLDGHPALGGYTFDLFDHIVFSIQEVCKRNICKGSKTFYQLYYSDKEAKKDIFKKEFEKEFKEIDDDFNKFAKTTNDKAKLKERKKSDVFDRKIACIYTTYEKVYGEKWEFDHIEYWGEIDFTVFMGKITDNIKIYSDRNNWGNFNGISVGASTFEEMIIKLANGFKKIYGNFNSEDFYTKREIDNNKKESIFSNKKIVDDIGRTMYRMIDNKKYIDVNDAMLNRRWLKWFDKTSYCKKNWDNEFKKILKKGV